MRFVPHRNVSLQYSQEPISSDYESLSESEFVSSDDENVDNNNDLLTPTTSDESLNILANILDETGLKERFDLTAELSGLKKNFEFKNIYQDNENTLTINHISNKPNQYEKLATLAEKNKHDILFNYFESNIESQRVIHRNKVAELIKQEEERVRKEEEERKRHEEEERKRIENEEKRRKEEIERIRKAEEERVKRNEEAKKAAEEDNLREKLDKEKKLKEKEQIKALNKAEEMEKKMQAAKEAASKSVTNFNEVENVFFKYKRDIDDIKTQVVNPMKENKDLKRLVNAHKRKINPKFGQLTNSQQQLTRITQEISQLMSETKANEIVFKWILNFVAKAIVSQAEAEVAVKPQSATSLAKLSLNLLLIFPELEYFFMARFIKKCPLLIGYTCSIDTEEGRQRMGWKRSGSKWEDETQYTERLGGICTLYSVMTRLVLDSSYLNYENSSKKHPLPISKSWIFLSRMANIPLHLVTNTHFTIVGSWWDSCGSQFLEAYGRQANKLLRLLWNDWTNAVADRKYSGAARLRLLGEDWQSTGNIKSFSAMER